VGGPSLNVLSRLNVLHAELQPAGGADAISLEIAMSRSDQYPGPRRLLRWKFPNVPSAGCAERGRIEPVFRRLLSPYGLSSTWLTR